MCVCVCVHIFKRVYRQPCMGINVCMWEHKYTYYTHMYV